MSPPASFLAKKAHILSLLSVNPDTYDDLSPKGSIDEGIRDLIDEINGLEGCVTTSSCAGRVSVFLEGKKRDVRDEAGVIFNGNGGGGKVEGGENGGEDLVGENGDENENVEVNVERETTAGIGGKGGGGHWLFVSHDPIPIPDSTPNAQSLQDPTTSWASKFGMRSYTPSLDAELQKGITSTTRFIHFKFEPMILHILTSSLSQAQLVLSSALQAGFRESGALGLITSSSSTIEEATPTPMVAIRSMGLALESVIGYHRPSTNHLTTTQNLNEEYCMIPEWQLRNLVEMANTRFTENSKRIARFRSLLLKAMGEGRGGKEGKMGVNGAVWEDKEVRRARMREEGLRRKGEAVGKGVGKGEGVNDGVEMEIGSVEGGDIGIGSFEELGL